MTPERWKRIEALLQQARGKPPADRAAYLAAACVNDEALRLDVESLLAESASDDGFLAEPALPMPRIVFDARNNTPPFSRSSGRRSRGMTAALQGATLGSRRNSMPPVDVVESTVNVAHR
jgi:hypothetical protein